MFPWDDWVLLTDEMVVAVVVVRLTRTTSTREKSSCLPYVPLPQWGFPQLELPALAKWMVLVCCTSIYWLLTSHGVVRGRKGWWLKEGKAGWQVLPVFFRNMEYFSKFQQCCLAHASLADLRPTCSDAGALGADCGVLGEWSSDPLPHGRELMLLRNGVGFGAKLCCAPVQAVPWFPGSRKEILKPTLQKSEASSINKCAHRLARWKKCKIPR